MTAAGAILAVLGTFAIPVMIFGGAEWLGEREHRAAIRARLKSIGEQSRDDLSDRLAGHR